MDAITDSLSNQLILANLSNMSLRSGSASLSQTKPIHKKWSWRFLKFNENTGKTVKSSVNDKLGNS